MSINIWTDSMQHAALLGKPVLFTNWLIQRDIIPDGWYCYDLRGTHKSPSTRTTLVDHAADYHTSLTEDTLLSYLKSPEDYIKTTAEQYMRNTPWLWSISQEKMHPKTA